MDISASLTRTEVVTLADSGLTCEESARKMQEEAGAQISKARVVFEESLRFKNTIDKFEEIGRSQPSWHTLSILINCEYKLFMLNQGTPLRHNPFLSHWVEAALRLSPKPGGGKATKRQSSEGISGEEICIVRTEFIKALLRESDASQFSTMSPKVLHQAFVELGGTRPFDISPYVRMLEEEGIYDRGFKPTAPNENGNQSMSANSLLPSPPPEELAEKADAESGSKNTELKSGPKLNDFQQWKRDILVGLKTDPEEARHRLTRLPVELSYLDFLTTLLQEGTLDKFSIDSGPLITTYLQHALRLTEQMGQPPSSGTPRFPSDSPNSSEVNGHLDDAANGLDGVDRGREAQARTVKLLLLFIRNLIRKRLVEVEVLYFEIQEICVRYLWIREVREFKEFVGGEVAR